MTRSFLQNLTLVNVNTSAAEELGWVLEVSDDVVAKIMEQRQVTPFANLAQLKALPGVDAAKLEQRKTRIAFKTPL